MGKNFLMIDDDRDEHEIFMEAVNKTQLLCECKYASGCAEAIKILKEFVPDYILLDINMPKVNGFECLTQIKQMRGFESVPVIMYSNGIDLATQTKALSSGAASCIQKTVSIAALAGIIQFLIANPGSILPNVIE